MQAAVTIAKAIECPDAVLTAIGKYGEIAFSPAYLPFKSFIYGNAAIAPFLQQLDAFRASYTKSNPFQEKIPGLETGHIIFMCLVYTIFFWLLPMFIFKFVWKKPLDFLRPFAIVHNAFLSALSGYMAFGIAITAVASGYTFWNNGFDAKHPLAWSMAKFQALFLLSKPYEFIDTFLICAFQNWKQLSVLHVSHHVSVPVIWWFVCNLAPTGDCWASSFANSFVHLFMYALYLSMLLSKKGGAVRSFIDKNKFAVTMLQIIQFTHNVSQGIFTLYFVKVTKYEPFLIKLMVAYCSYLLALFINFFVQNAILGGGKKKDPKAAAAEADAAARKSGNAGGRQTAPRTSNMK